MKYLICFLFLYHSFVAAESDFDVLMGKKTKHWQFVASEKDKAFLTFAKEIYEKNRAAALESAYKIPPVVHFIWLGPKHFPPESVENVRTWIAQHPGWKVKLWTDRARIPPCEGMETVDVASFPFQRLRRAFDESENWGEKSDILRYEILLQEGGVYADHDANCLKPFDSLHQGYDFYCGLEAPHEAFVGRNITCGNGVIGARAGHPTVKRVIDTIEERWDLLKQEFRGKDPHSQIEIVMQRTYIALTHSLEETMNLHGNTDIVFPAAYFFAKSGIPSVFSHHFYATSWDDFRKKKSDAERKLEKAAGKMLHDARSMSRNALLVLIFHFFLILLVIQLRKKRS
jgi:Glycosyltransferase sugar-binding region containing DXD motif